MPPAYDTIFFDLDGVLVDSEPAIARCLRAVFAEASLEGVTAEAVRSLIGPPLEAGIRRILAARGEDPGRSPALVSRYRELYRGVATRETRLQPGIGALLDRLQGDATLAVATSKPRCFAEPILRALGVFHRFATVAGPELDAVQETKTETLRRAVAQTAERTGRPVDLARAAMVGDREPDIAAARTLGVRAIGATWGYGSREELEAAGAHLLVDRPEELLEVVLGAKHAG